ncbi:hypothetical protein [Polluticaenibacter yanchengensis]|uniref:DUF4468 domain-containing protein n=1 Tax=Polluticaenibacter yanchengensis TaxID=3014562 RepID=A0ABT4UPT6_9BACT|nr:hypothetical protein [Chitinophagaceae bacterium LY-5]
MKLYSLTLAVFLMSCNSNDISYQPEVTLLDTVVNRTEAITIISSAIPHIYENDTTIIRLKKININLLDIRYDSTDKRELSIQKGKLIIGNIKIPTQKDIQGFAVNWIKETKSGFEISIEYGGSSRYYHKDFRFYYENGDFILKDILINTFDKRNPEDEKSYTKKIDMIKETIKGKDFKIADFL